MLKTRLTGKKTPVKPTPTWSRKQLYRLHAWVGFHLAVIMALVLFTGSFAVISNEIDWLFHPEMRVTPSDEKVSWGVMQSAIRIYRPNDTLVSLSAMQGDYFAWRAFMGDEYGRYYYIHINQWTGEITGTTSRLTVQRFFRDLHRYLFMPRIMGLPLVTSLAFVLIISLYTGLKTTKKWRTLATRLRTNKGIRIAIGDAHKASGLWASWLIVVIIVTGIWYLAEFAGDVAGSKFEPARPGVSLAREASFGPVIQDANADTLITASKATFPELEPRVINFALGSQQAVTIQGRNNNFLLRNRANRIFLDPVDASIIKVQRASEISWVAFLNEMADPLHFGYLGGLATKLIWFVFGLAMTFLSLSGVWLTWRRLKTSAPSRAQLATLPIILASLFFGIIWYQRLVGPFLPDSEIRLSEQVGENLSQELIIALDNQGNPNGKIRFLISAATGRPNVQKVIFALESPKHSVTAPVNSLGQTVIVYSQLPVEQLRFAKRLLVSIQLRTKERIETTWNLDHTQNR